MEEDLKFLSWMIDNNNLRKSISNPVTIAAAKTSLSHVSMLYATVWDRRWRTKSQMNFTSNVRFAFLIVPMGFRT